jgi:Tol biopolymer transport system component
VLDFGVAKTLDGGAGALAADSTGAPALATETGMIVGTPAYMSPEQARGQTVDKRSDIWAFGCVLYELLTGRHPFPGATPSERIAGVLEREPAMEALPPATPPRIRWLVQRCLRKDPRRRLHDLADARIELDEALNTPESDGAPAVAAAGRGRERADRRLFAWTAGAALAGIALGSGLGWLRGSDAVAPAPVYNTSLVLPEDVRPGANPAGRFTLSPDGRMLAISAADTSGRTLLWIRLLSSSVLQPLAGTDGASFPFWSPDSRSVGFIAQGKLKTVSLDGGAPTTLADVNILATSSWSKDNVILFTPAGGSPLHRISARGGASTPVTTLDRDSGDAQHWYPYFLPDGRRFLFFAVGSKARGVTDPRAVMLGSLDSPEVRQIVDTGSNAKYANGRLLYFRGGTLIAQPFDPETGTLSGEGAPVVEQVQIAGAGATGVAAAFSVSDGGQLVYQTGQVTRSRLKLFDRSGKETATLGDAADYGDVSLSPDGKRAAVSVADPLTGTRSIWVYDLARGIRERVSTDAQDDFAPTWSPVDSDVLVHSSRRTGGGIQLFRKLLRGNAPAELLYEDDLGKFAAGWSRDGRLLVYIAGGGIIARSDLWVLSVADRRAKPWLETQRVESQPQFSPDGRWIAYMAGPSTQAEIVVAPYPGPGAGRQVTTAGGQYPRWRRDGSEIYSISPDRSFLATAISTGNEVTIGASRRLFTVRTRPAARLDAFPYDVSADGKTFLINTFVEEPAVAPITLLANWPAGLKP